MDFFFANVTQDAPSMLLSLIKNKAKRAGIEFHYRERLSELSEVEKYLESVITNKSFGMSPTYCFDIRLKPEIMLGSPVVVRRINISIGVTPPNNLHISIWSEGKIQVSTRNLFEKLNLTENLIIKILYELGLLSLLKSRFHHRLVVWEVSSSNSKIRSLDYWRKNLKELVQNKLFPLSEEDLEKDNIEITVFPNEDTIICVPSRCLVYDVQHARAQDLPFRFFAIFTKEPKEETILYEFLFRIDEILPITLAIQNLFIKATNVEQKIGEVERSFDEIVEQVKKNTKPSNVFEKIEKLDPPLWRLTKGYYTFMEELKYVTNLVKTRNLKRFTDMIVNKMRVSKIGYLGGHGLLQDLDHALGGGLVRLTSKASILDTRFKNLNNEFNSLKTTLTTQIQIELEKRNLAIQNALGLLQILAVMLFSFELIRYFHPFTNDLQHILTYVVFIILPSILVYFAYRKWTRVGSVHAS